MKIIDDRGYEEIYAPRQNNQYYVIFSTEPLEQILPKIGGMALKVFLVLNSRYWNNDKEEVTITRDELIKATGLNEMALRAGLKELRQQKILIPIKERYSSTKLD